MLGFLGYLRLEGVGLQGGSNTVANSTVTIEMIEESETTPDNPVSREEQIIRSFPSFSLFVMSSILFALAGAICLSISIPNLTMTERKIRYRALIRYYHKKAKDILKIIEYARLKQNEYKVACQEAELQVSLLRPIEIVEDEWNALIRKGDILLEDMAFSVTQREKALYLEGYERGTKFSLNGELYFSPYQVLRRIFNAGKSQWSVTYSDKKRSGNNGSDRNNTPIRNPPGVVNKRGDYLHQEIRRMIDFTFTRNQNDYNNENN